MLAELVLPAPVGASSQPRDDILAGELCLHQGGLRYQVILTTQPTMLLHGPLQILQDGGVDGQC